MYVHFHSYGPPVDLPYRLALFDLRWDAFHAIPDFRPPVYDSAINRSELVFREEGVHQGETKVVRLSISPTNPTMTWHMFGKAVGAVDYFLRTFEAVDFPFYVEVDGFPGVVGTGNFSETWGGVNTS